MKLSFLISLGALMPPSQSDLATRNSIFNAAYVEYAGSDWQKKEFGSCMPGSINGNSIEWIFFYRKAMCSVYTDSECQNLGMKFPMQYKSGISRVDARYPYYQVCYSDDLN